MKQRNWWALKENRRARLRIGLTITALTVLSGMLPAETLVPAQSNWRYLDDGSDQGSAWREVEFEDGAWSSGPAQLGYGNNGEVTTIGFGTNSSDKFITTYFRHSFSVVDPGRYEGLTLSLLRDDGAVVYLNGREVFRSNMPQGEINFLTRASGAVGGAGESRFYATTVSVTNLVAGFNVLAVELHQAKPTSSDTSFDLELVGHRPPLQFGLDFPPDNALDVRRNVQLGVSIPDAQGENLSVAFYGRPVDTTLGPDFTIVALPDTQYYVSSKNGGTPEQFIAQTDWIVANRASRNIVFVTQLGDCVENGDNNGNDIEWLHATNALYRLENPLTTLLAMGIPYGVAVGNHDQSPFGNPLGSTTFYNQYFGVPHFDGRPYYGGHYGTNNDNHFELFSASGLDFIAIHLEYDPSADAEVLAWADALLTAHTDRRAIIISHYLLGKNDNAAFSAQGQATYDALKAHPNLFLMLCGHVVGEGKRTDTFGANTVYTLMSDYQGRSNGGNGYLRLLEFSPSNHVVRVKTYSPTLDQFETDADSEFTLPYDMNRLGPWTSVGAISDITTTTNVAVAWAGLQPETTYEWRAEITYGNTTLSSATRRFTTASNTPPTVTLIRVAEADGAGFLPQVTLAIEADAEDLDGAIERVEFRAEETELCTDTEAPFACAWHDVPVGVYNIVAVATDNEGMQAISAPVNVVIELPGQPVGAKINAPSALAATAASANQIDLHWRDNADNETGFVMERAAAGGVFEQIALLPANTTSVQDGQVQPGTQYAYRIYAYNPARASVYCLMALVSTPPDPATAVPLDLRLDPTDQTIHLAWPAIPGAVYRVIARDQLVDRLWYDLSADLPAAGETLTWEEPFNPSVPARFYGIRRVQ